MTSIVSKLARNISISESPWQFKLLAMLVIMFFAGGVLLDHLASTIDIQGLSGAPENKELDQMIITFAKEKHKALSSSANLLYDFSKIALGALIASVTQGLKLPSSNPKQGSGSNA